MALPDFTGWSVSHWTGGNTGTFARDCAGAAKEVKDFLVTRGWSVRRSSDNTTISDTDRWTSDTAFANGAWSILGKSGREICLHFCPGGMGNFLIVYLSRSSVFVGDHTYNAPTATDREQMDNTFWFATNTPTLGSRRLDFWWNGNKIKIIGHGINNGTTNCMFAIDEVDSPIPELVENFAIAVGNPTISNQATAQTNGLRFAYKIGSDIIYVRMISEGDQAGWLCNQTTYSAPLPDGERVIQRIKYWMSQHAEWTGIFGKCHKWFATHSNVPSGTTFPADGSKTHIVYNNIVLPWDGTASWTG